jgi:ubiquitin C-terminal hydrolase
MSIDLYTVDISNQPTSNISGISGISGTLENPIVVTDNTNINNTTSENIMNTEIDTASNELVIKPLRTGLINRGNDCFINAAIQCLAVSPFIHAFIKRYQVDDNKMVRVINKYNLGKLKSDEMQEYVEKLLEENLDIIPDEKRILEQVAKRSGDIFIYVCFKELINNIQSRKHKTIACSTLISVAQEISENTGFEHLFSGEQNDPHELMAFLLDKIHSAKANSVSIELPANFEELDKYFKLYLNHFKSRYQNDFSMFVRNFYYYILNCIECSSCSNQTFDVSPNDIMCVSLPVNWRSAENISLDNCISEMFKVEGIDYKCEKCGNTEHNRMDKKLLTKPKTLIIKIKRYTQIGQMLVKVNKMIQYPEYINLAQYFCGVGMEDYKLYAVINHIGSMGGGHYYSYIRDMNIITENNKQRYEFEDRWYLCNDSNVREMSFEEVMQSNNAYMLFYHSDNQ